MGEKKIEKPITMLRMEFAQALADLVNNSGLRAFIMEPILNDCLNELRFVSERELKNDIAQYENAMKQDHDEVSE